MTDARLDRLERTVTALVGIDERNGRIGRLETELTATKRWLKIATGALVSVLLAVAGSGWAVVQRMNERAREAGREDERDRSVERRLDRVEGFLLGAGHIEPVRPAGVEP